MLILDIFLSFKDFNFCSFVNFCVQQETERVHLLNQLCSPDNFKHSQQITLSEKMMIIANQRNGKQYLLASLLQFGLKSNFLRTYG